MQFNVEMTINGKDVVHVKQNIRIIYASTLCKIYMLGQGATPVVYKQKREREKWCAVPDHVG